MLISPIFQCRIVATEALAAQTFEEFGVLGKLALQFAFVAQFEVLEAEGGGYGAAHQAETGFRWDVSREPLFGLYHYLHLVVGIEVVHGQAAVRINYINVESLASVVVPNFRHIVQAVESGEVAAGKHIVYGGDGLGAAVVVAVNLPEVSALGVGLQLQSLNVFLCVHKTFLGCKGTNYFSILNAFSTS